MANKYDTNPLNGDLPKEQGDDRQTAVLRENASETAPFPPPTMTEEQTRRFEDPAPPAYQAPEAASESPVPYQAPGALENAKVKGIGIKEKTVVAFSYFPGVGFALGLLVLFLAPSTESKARFHAAQSVAAHAFIGVAITILNLINAGAAAKIFGSITSIVMLVFTYKAWKGKPVYIESVSQATEWLEEMTSPKK